MFYLTEVEDYIRVEPKLFGLPTIEAINKQLRDTYIDYYDKELGTVISVIEVLNVGEGVIIPGELIMLRRFLELSKKLEFMRGKVFEG